MSKDIKLKPCPFCGGEAKLTVSNYVACQDDFAEVKCAECGIGFHFGIDVEYSAKDRAIEVWNRRITDNE